MQQEENYYEYFYEANEKKSPAAVKRIYKDLLYEFGDNVYQLGRIVVTLDRISECYRYGDQKMFKVYRRCFTDLHFYIVGQDSPFSDQEIEWYRHYIA